MSYIVIFSHCNKDIKAKFTRNECIRTSTSHALGNEGKTVVGEGKKKKSPKRCPHSVSTDRSSVFWRVTLVEKLATQLVEKLPNWQPFSR